MLAATSRVYSTNLKQNDTPKCQPNACRLVEKGVKTPCINVCGLYRAVSSLAHNWLPTPSYAASQMSVGLCFAKCPPKGLKPPFPQKCQNKMLSSFLKTLIIHKLHWLYFLTQNIRRIQTSVWLPSKWMLKWVLKRCLLLFCIQLISQFHGSYCIIIGTV